MNVKISEIFKSFGGIIYKGEIDCSYNPNYPAANCGHVYTINVTGRIGGNSGRWVNAGDLIICKVDSSLEESQEIVGNNWNILQGVLLTNTTIIDPFINTIGTTSLIDSFSGILISLTKPGNPQILQSPTILTSGKTYTVINNNSSGLNTIDVNGITLIAGKAQTWIWNGVSWKQIDIGITSLPVPISQGGTGLVSLNNHSILLGSDVDTINQLEVGKTGEVLMGQNDSDPIWVSNPILNSLKVNSLTINSLSLSNGEEITLGVSSINVSSDYTILDYDTYKTIFISGNTIIKLPRASKKRIIKFKKIDTSETIITIQKSDIGFDTIESEESIILDDSIILESDGISTWYKF